MKNFLFCFAILFSLNFLFAQNEFPETGINQTAIIDGALPYNGKLNLINNSSINLESGSDINMSQGSMLFSKDVFVTPIEINQGIVRLKNGFTDFHMNSGGISGLNFGFAVYKNSLSDYPQLNPISGIGFINSVASSERLYMTHGTTPWNSTLGINVLSNGFTGIGTLAPTSELEITAAPDGVYGNSGLTFTNLTASHEITGKSAIPLGVDGSGKVILIEGSGASSRDAWLLLGNSGTDASVNFLGTTDNQPLVIKTNNSERLKITTTGRLIFHNNTSSPNDLDNLYIGGGNETATSAYFANTAIGMASLSSINASGYRNTALGSNSLRANTSGKNNVGLGYDSGANITSGSNNIILGSSINSPISATADNQLNIGNWIYGYNGQIAIGTFSNLETAFANNDDPTDFYQLFVKNGIKTEKVRVELANVNGWPDYVFEKDYDLMPIEELVDFISTNKHLPNIPKAAELVNDGINLAEMDAKLLEKIEELTLYNIDLYKENQVLKEEYEQQQQLLEELIKRVEQLESNK